MLTDQEEARIQAIEKALNSLRRITLNLATKREMRQTLIIRQQEVDELKTQVASLQEQVALLQQD